MKFVVSTAFATEGIAAQELRNMGITDVVCKDNRVYFEGSVSDAAKACIWIRSADRIGVLVSTFKAMDFDSLFDGIKCIPWCDYISKNSKILVDARCVRSKIMSQRDVQRVSKKAIIDSLARTYKNTVFRENGSDVCISVSILNDEVSVIIDLCGDGLHKRGYRLLNSEAPLRETLAASLLLLSNYTSEHPFFDPFCGSGTLPIEAAMIAANIAPGKARSYLAEKYPWAQKEFKAAKNEAASARINNDYEVFCGDIDPRMVEMTKYHAERAGVSVNVKCRDACKWDDIYQYGGVMVTNPPYGERLSNKEDVCDMLKNFSFVTSVLLDQYWNLGIITPETELEKLLYVKSISRRKLFNSNIQCTFFQFKNNT